METLVDASIWVDLVRPNTARGLKSFIEEIVAGADVFMVEPIAFEVLAYATEEQGERLRQLFQAYPELATPSDLWEHAIECGKVCRKHAETPGHIDLLIATSAVHHRAKLLTFDSDFQRLSKILGFRVEVLKRPM